MSEQAQVLDVQEQAMMEAMAARVHAARAALDPATGPAYADLPEPEKSLHRAAANAVLQGLAPHIASLLRGIGDVAVQREQQAREYHAAFMAARADVAALAVLLREAQTHVTQAKWQGDLAATGLLARIEKALAEHEVGAEP